MKFSENWLRTWVNPDLTSEELSHLLTMAGLEVEAMERVAPAFSGVVVAEVLSVEKHPDADRLNVCRVNVGEAEPLAIVCGAPNVKAGIRVPCARIGAVLPNDFRIRQAKVRGIESFGMLCSSKELGLPEESDGLLILPGDAPVGEDLRRYLDFDDHLYTLKLTPNRSDCSGIAGIAREVAALTGCGIHPISVADTPAALSDRMEVRIDDKAACPLYCGRLVKGINANAKTPAWMQRRLERSGVRSISAVVDITNYVMMEFGQPMHAFDADKLSGGITVRRATNGESLRLLNDQSVTLDEQVLVIADQKRALALAGIMGGQDSSVGDDTKNVFLEAAYFHPDAIAGRARRFGLATDSSFRFERGVDFAATRKCLERATQLIIEICGGQACEATEISGTMPVREPITLRASRVCRVLGITLETDRIASILERLKLGFKPDGDLFIVTPPSFRHDLEIEADLIEEVARIHGYENIPAISPHARLTMLPDSETVRSISGIKQKLVERDYQEIVSLSFSDLDTERTLSGNADPVHLQNPIASNLSVMRSSLLGGLLAALRFNLNRRQARVRLFEAGACFSRSDNGYAQNERVSGIAYGSRMQEQWGAKPVPVDFYDVKADVEALLFPSVPEFLPAPHPAFHPGRSAEIFCGGRSIGWMGELHPNWQQDMPQACILFELDADALMKADVPHLEEVAKSLPVRRDLAVLVDEHVPAKDLADAMREAKAPYVQEITLFDVYRGTGVAQGKKSLAFRVLLQDTQKTLNEGEIEQSIALLVDALNNKGAQLRM